MFTKVQKDVRARLQDSVNTECSDEAVALGECITTGKPSPRDAYAKKGAGNWGVIGK